ncbi:MAG: cobaltochelatase subunit CobN [Dysgonamonadaceae bacterium]|jgi:cobaltochelatase CobN|nr:cobaltochelatase subunit CobN [Dysgonamonadaceae bacterium]
MKKGIIPIVCLSLIAVCIVVWQRTASATKIALVDFQPFQRASMVKANDDRHVRFDEVSPEKFSKLKSYDFVLGFGMGMHITAEQRAMLQRAADAGTPVYIYAATNPENAICNLDSATLSNVKAYLDNGNKRNYRSLARYVRQNIDRKKFFVLPPDSVHETETDVLYHLDETASFSNVVDYEAFLRREKIYVEDAWRIAIVGGLNDPFSGNRANTDSLIVSLQRAGMNVYPVFSITKRLDFLRDIKPDAVIYFAHGRLAMGQNDAAVEWLRERNIPLFAPLSLLQTREEWEKDPQGMSGGFLSQSIVVPELDGAITPYVVNAQEIDDEGLYLFKAVPSRLSDFTSIVSGYLELKRKSNAEKRVAIYYFKGPGQATLTAQGLETVPSLYKLLQRLRNEGYRVENLPPTEAEFKQLLMTQGSVLSTYAKGALDDFLKDGKPAMVSKNDYEAWVSRALPEALYADVVENYGVAPGDYMADNGNIAVARLEFGNIALLPQPMAGLGDDAFAIVHGAKTAPPHTYIASYLWARYAFRADALLHFGTHGSLEFTPSKQVALGNFDWADRLIGSLPHFYYYTIGNIGESMMAKRRSYASLLSYLTPAFSETQMRGQFRDLQNAVSEYQAVGDSKDSLSILKKSLKIKRIALSLGLHCDLRFDSLATTPLSAEEIVRIDNFAEEIANEKMTGGLYTTGEAFDADKIRSTVLAMSADPIAYSLAALDKLSGKTADNQLKNRSFFTKKYLEPAKLLVLKVFNGLETDDELICAVAHITPEDLQEAKTVLTPPRRTMPMLAEPKPSEAKPTSSGGGHPSWIPKTSKKTDTTQIKTVQTPAKPASPKYSPEQKSRARAISEVERTIRNITAYKTALEESPEKELKSLLNALGGGYTSPSSGGDAVANPQAVPTGRNLYAINAEATPSESAWEKGVALAQQTLDEYRKRHGGYPQKVSYTFWSSEFIETEGATIAQVLYMLGVEPIRDTFGRVSDLQLIPSETLGRPRIDVLAQTSGQFRDLAASRLALLGRAVEMAAAANEGDNRVAKGSIETERLLVEQGVPPQQAREMSTQRIFGGINGMYGTNIQGMTTNSDRWESADEIADTYIHNMGATYGNEKTWGQFHEGLLRTALRNTDVVVQPRQSNTWGALSLDHVYEFMGGLNLAVRSVNGKDPDAFFADYRNRNNVRMQDLREAIGVEARSTVFNPAYIREVMKGKASSAAQITEVVTNTFGWNVMKPDVIDNELWNKLFSVYVKDEYQLGTEAFFRRENPQALQEITAVMLETARKGMWQASNAQLDDLAQLHTALVRDYGSSASGFSGGNAKLQDFIAKRTDAATANAYRRQLQKMQTAVQSPEATKNGVVLKKNEVAIAENGRQTSLNGLWVAAAVLVVFVALLLILRKKRKR